MKRAAAILWILLLLAPCAFAFKKTLYNGAAKEIKDSYEIAIDSCSGDMLFACRVKTLASDKGYTLFLASPSDTLALRVAGTKVSDPIYDEDCTVFTLTVASSQTVGEGRLPIKVFSKSKGFNTVRIERVGGEIAVFAGAAETMSVSFQGGERLRFGEVVTSVGIIADDDAPITLQSSLVSSELDLRQYLSCGLTHEELSDVVEESYAPCGFWQMLDFDLDDRYLRIGGDYKVAVIPLKEIASEAICARELNLPEGSLAMIYCSGSVASAQLWREGMVKGFMIPGAAQNLWKLLWYDSKGELLDVDSGFSLNSVVVEGTSHVMQLNFPSRYSSLRFLKTN